MGQYHMNRIFRPEKIAVLGASETPGTIGNAIMTNLIQGQFSGAILPVNPKYSTIHNLTVC